MVQATSTCSNKEQCYMQYRTDILSCSWRPGTFTWPLQTFPPWIINNLEQLSSRQNQVASTELTTLHVKFPQVRIILQSITVRFGLHIPSFRSAVRLSVPQCTVQPYTTTVRDTACMSRPLDRILSTSRTYQLTVHSPECSSSSVRAMKVPLYF